jgi:tRNA (guanine37-N1)-methyltransferase
MKKIERKLVVDIISLFPDFINYYLGAFGILKKARQSGVFDVRGVNLRDYSFDERGTVDDRPYGGGVGMVLRPDVVHNALRYVISNFQFPISKGNKRAEEQDLRLRRIIKDRKTRVVLLSARGKRFTQREAEKLAKFEHLVFVCGRYEGVDERVSKFVDVEYSIGDYVLMGGELPALVITEAVARLVPGVIGKMESTENESFSSAMLEYPQYTKPEVWEVGGKKMRVPKVLLSGHHGKIDEWRDLEAKKRTKKMRPDMIIND